MIDFLMAAADGAHGAAQGLGGPAEMWDAIVRDFSNIGEPGAYGFVWTSDTNRSVRS